MNKADADVLEVSDTEYVARFCRVFQVPGKEVLKARRLGRSHALLDLAYGYSFDGEASARAYRIMECRQGDDESQTLLEMVYLIAYTTEYYHPANEGVYPYVEN